MQRPRLCARPGCGVAATATLSFQYGSGTVWLDDLGPKEPSTIDLCSHHADRLAPPKGWTGHDRRATTLRGAERDRPLATGSGDRVGDRAGDPRAGDVRAQAS